MGFTPDFFMRAAGAVEFALAFSLIWTPLVRRVGAIMLAAMFVSAVFEFGKIDLIGHSLIVVALFGIIADDGGKRRGCAIPGYCRSAMPRRWPLFLAVYYVAHAELFGTVDPLIDDAIDILLTCTTSSIFGWMAHSTSKSPATGNVIGVTLPGFWSPESNENFRRIDIGVMQQIGVVVDDLDGLAALDGDFAGMKFAPLLRDRILRRRLPTSVPNRGQRRHREPIDGNRTARARNSFLNSWLPLRPCCDGPWWPQPRISPLSDSVQAGS